MPRRKGVYEIPFYALERKVKERKYVRRLSIQHVRKKIVCLTFHPSVGTVGFRGGRKILCFTLVKRQSWMVRRSCFVNIPEMLGQGIPDQIKKVALSFLVTAPDCSEHPEPVATAHDIGEEARDQHDTKRDTFRLGSLFELTGLSSKESTHLDKKHNRFLDQHLPEGVQLYYFCDRFSKAYRGQTWRLIAR